MTCVPQDLTVLLALAALLSAMAATTVPICTPGLLTLPTPVKLATTVQADPRLQLLTVFSQL